jgi:hypothetical protein
MLPTDQNEWIRYKDLRKIALKPFFYYFPRLALDVICITDNNGSFQRALDLVSDIGSERRETALGCVPTDVLIDWCNEKPDIRYVFASDACKLFEKQDNNNAPLVISDTAAALFAAAPDKVAVVHQFVRRFHPRTYSGSLADILEARLPLFDQLVSTDNEAVRSSIATAKTEMKKWIDAERTRENNEEKSRNSSFE